MCNKTWVRISTLSLALEKPRNKIPTATGRKLLLCYTLVLRINVLDPTCSSSKSWWCLWSTFVRIIWPHYTWRTTLVISEIFVNITTWNFSRRSWSISETKVKRFTWISRKNSELVSFKNSSQIRAVRMKQMWTKLTRQPTNCSWWLTPIWMPWKSKIKWCLGLISSSILSRIFWTLSDRTAVC